MYPSWPVTRTRMRTPSWSGAGDRGRGGSGHGRGPGLPGAGGVGSDQAIHGGGNCGRAVVGRAVPLRRCAERERQRPDGTPGELGPRGGVAEFHPVTGTATSAAQRPAGHPVRGEKPVDHLVHRTAAGTTTSGFVVLGMWSGT